MYALFAQMRGAGGSVGTWGFAEIVIAIIVIAAIIGILFVALRQFGIAIPSFVFHIFWIVCAAFLCIIAIRFLLTM